MINIQVQINHYTTPINIEIYVFLLFLNVIYITTITCPLLRSVILTQGGLFKDQRKLLFPVKADKIPHVGVMLFESNKQRQHDCPSLGAI